MATPKSPKPSPFSKLFNRGSNKAADNTGPLQQDMAQAQLVAAARSKAKSSGRIERSPKRKSDKGDKSPSSPRGSSTTNVSPRAGAAAAAGATGGTGSSSPRGAPPATAPATSNGASSPRNDGGVSPPPLPKKKDLIKDDLQDFIFCVECGARNKPFRKQCVKCNEELEIPEEIQRRLPKKACPSKCVVSGAGVESGPQREQGSGIFTVALRDEEGGPVAVVTAGRLEILIEGPSGEVEATVTPVPGDTSAVRVEYGQIEPGAYQVMVALEEAELGDAPFVVDVLQVVAAGRCTAAGSALEAGVTAQQAAELVVATRDVCGNPCMNGGAEIEVRLELQDTGAASPRSPRPAEGAATSVRDREDGTYEVAVRYATPGRYNVVVTVNGAAVAGSPFAVTVDKAPTAGSKWQARFEDEAGARRKQREAERQAEIERAKEKFLEHAEQAKAAAAAKEAAQLAEEKRQRDIEEHMERMRTEEGDEVRAAVLDKVKAQASHTLYEPVDDPTSPGRAGKKWAAQFNEEDNRRKAEREAERQAEIAAAKDKYLEHASQAVYHAQSKEELQLAEEARLRDIEEHQRDLRRQNNLGGIAVLERKSQYSGESVSSPSSSDDDEGDARKPAKSGAADEDVSSEITPSSDDSDAEPRRTKKEAAPTATVSPRSERSLAPPGAAAATGTRSPGHSPRPAGRSARGAIPDTGGRVLPYAELKGAAARWQDELDVENLEAYLSDDEFAKVMGISKEKFYQLPSWRRQQIKKERAL